jgi:hypothetical protein
MDRHAPTTPPLLPGPETPWLFRLRSRGAGVERFGIGFGLLLALGAGWPLYYGLSRLGDPDFEALAAGGIGIAIGLSVFMWAIRALHRPIRAVWVDQQERTVTLTQGVQHDVTSQPDRVASDALGPLELYKWERRVRSSKGGTRTYISWCVVARQAFGDRRLCVRDSQKQAQEWADRLARLAAWTGPGWAEPDRTWPASRRLASPWIGAALLTVLVGGLIWLLPTVLELQNDYHLHVVITAGTWTLLAGLWLRAGGQPLMGAGVSLAGGGALLAKPLVAPIVFRFGDEAHVMGLTSETHLYYLVPGAALVVVGILIALRR